MNKLLSGMCASMLAVSFALSGVAPVNAAPIFVPLGQAAGSAGQGLNPDVQYVRDGWRRHGGRGWNRGWAGGPWGGRDMPFYNRGGGRRYDGWGGRYYRGGGGRDWAYHNGYRGYRYYRPGYRRYNDFWFPAGAFIAGALISGAIANSAPRYSYRGGSAHERWCYSRYRSYRAWDNTFQPYNGPRRPCYSPY